ncbi:MAG: hypothetical protein H0W79_05935 [Rubrobacteraceae bacterium]|nr:hypothetical protein [Rubrobacteraceae bacterium]MBA3702356.1 hypothetical protein [Rubrobacteraceae bacterium]MDQ3251009.1 hypothetical protein [Actinomycetota bacterium]
MLALMLAFASLACAGEQAGNAQGKQKGTEKVVTVSETTAGAETKATYDTSVQASTSTSVAGDADFYKVECRMQTHIFKEDMSKAEAEDFTSRITDRVQANLNGGGDKNLGDILDDLKIPAYDKLCG